MTKADIADRIAQQCGHTKKEAQELLESVFRIMKDTLESGEDLKISGFGKFELKQKNNRRGRNPQTGETITIEARRILTFRPSSILRQLINDEQSPPQ
jgi:integration host factor subunit alpha